MVKLICIKKELSLMSAAKQNASKRTCTKHGPQVHGLPRGPPIIFEDEFLSEVSTNFGILNGRNCGQFFFVNLRNRTGEERKRQNLCAKRVNNFV